MLWFHVLLLFSCISCIGAYPVYWGGGYSDDFAHRENWFLPESPGFPNPNPIQIPSSYYMDFYLIFYHPTNVTVRSVVSIGGLIMGGMLTGWPPIINLNSTMRVRNVFDGTYYFGWALIRVQPGCTGTIYFIDVHEVRTKPNFVFQVEEGATMTLDGGAESANWIDIYHNGTINIFSGASFHVSISSLILELNGAVNMRGPEPTLFNVTYTSMIYNPRSFGLTTVNLFDITGPAQILMPDEKDVFCTFNTLKINSPSYTTFIAGRNVTINSIQLTEGSNLRIATRILRAAAFAVPAMSVVSIEGAVNTSSWDIQVGFLNGSGEVRVSNRAVFTAGATGVTFNVTSPDTVTFTGVYTSTTFDISGTAVFNSWTATSVSNEINVLAGAWVTIAIPLQDSVINVAAGGAVTIAAECTNCTISSAGTIHFVGSSPPASFEMISGYAYFAHATVSAIPTPAWGSIVFENVTFAPSVTAIQASWISLGVLNSEVTVPLTVTSGSLQITGAAVDSVTCASSVCNLEATTLSSLTLSGFSTVSSSSITIPLLNWEGGSLEVNGQVQGGTFAPSLAIVLTSGTLEISGPVTWASGNLAIDSGAVLSISAPLTSASGTLSGSGSVVISGGALTCAGVSVASLSVLDGEAVFAQSSTITEIVVSSGSLVGTSVSATYLTVNGPSSIINSTFSVASSLQVASLGSVLITGPQFALTGSATVDGYFTLSAATFDCNAEITVNPGGTLELGLPYTMDPPCLVSGDGTVLT